MEVGQGRPFTPIDRSPLQGEWRFGCYPGLKHLGYSVQPFHGLSAIGYWLFAKRYLGPASLVSIHSLYLSLTSEISILDLFKNRLLKLRGKCRLAETRFE